MPTEILTGQAVLHGIQNDGTAISIDGYATFILNKLSNKHEFELKKVQDATGFTCAAVAIDESVVVTCDITLSGATKTAAAATGVYPAPLAAITLSHVKLQGTFGSTGNTSVKIFDGEYCYEGGATIDLNNTDFAKLTGLTLRKYANDTQNTSMTTAVTT